jgi:myo-inositol-1(or 4)-monophosphatase
MDSAYVRAGWGDAYGYLLVATGRAEAMVDPVMEVWDCGPFPPIYREAGGYFGDWKGKETIYGREALATTQILLPEVLPLLAAS